MKLGGHELHSCLAKKRFASRKHAKDAAKRFSHDLGYILNPYQCPYCKGYHLTKRR